MLYRYRRYRERVIYRYSSRSMSQGSRFAFGGRLQWVRGALAASVIHMICSNGNIHILQSLLERGHAEKPVHVPYCNLKGLVQPQQYMGLQYPHMLIQFRHPIEPSPDCIRIAHDLSCQCGPRLAIPAGQRMPSHQCHLRAERDCDYPRALPYASQPQFGQATMVQHVR